MTETLLIEEKDTFVQIWQSAWRQCHLNKRDSPLKQLNGSVMCSDLSGIIPSLEMGKQIPASNVTEPGFEPKSLGLLIILFNH